MTQIAPAANHPLRIKSEIPRFNTQSVERQNKAEQQASMSADVMAFLNAGGSVDCLPGFPEVIKSQSAHPWIEGS
ncbi:MAG: hypothetical protein V7785_21860 [Bermanella sp.]